MDQNTKNQLTTYIVKQLQSGLTPDDIAGQLRGAGWREENIQEGFSSAHEILQPTPAEAPSSQISPGEPPNSPESEGAQPQPDTEVQQVQAVLPAPIQRGKLKTGWLLFKQSLSILRTYPGLMKYPAISIAISLVLTGLIIGLFVYDAVSNTNALSTEYINYQGERDREATVPGMLLGLTFYLLTAFVTYFYATALSAHVLSIFRGEAGATSTFIRTARSKSGAIAVYSLIDVTIGLLLRFIAERFKLLGWIVSKILGALWSLATTFTVPIIADTSDNGLAAVKRSLSLFKANWGETIVGRVSMGGLALLAYLAVFLPLMFLLFILLGGLLQEIGILIAFAIFFIGIIAFVTVEIAATHILNTALYYFAQYKVIPPSFDPELLASVFVQKKKK